MNNDTKNKLVSGTDQSDLTTGNACWETPPAVFEQLQHDFGPFDLDLTADKQRHLVGTWFGPDSPVGQYDALEAKWCDHGRSGYSNPPYGPFIQRLLPYALNQAFNFGFSTTLLLPMRVTKAFKAYVLKGASDLLFCDSRLTFFENGIPRLNEKNWRERRRAVADPAVFDSIIVRYRPNVTKLNVGIWHVPKHVSTDDLDRAVSRRKKVA